MFFRHRKSEFCLKFQWFEGCSNPPIVTYIIKIEENTRNRVFFLFPAGHFFRFFLDIKRKLFLHFFAFSDYVNKNLRKRKRPRGRL